MLESLASGTQETELSHSTLSSGASISCAFPKDPTNIGLVVIPDWQGMRPLVDETITQIASMGIAVIAVDPFCTLDLDHSSMTREEKFSYLHTLDDTKQCANFLAAAQILRTQHNCAKVSLIGFCIGGMYSFKCAGTGEFDNVISCYGMITLPDDWKGPGQREPLDYLALESCSPVLAMFGDDDSFAPSDDLVKLRATLSNPHHTHIGSEIVLYPGASHAFMHDPERDEYSPVDSKDAWARALTLINPVA